MTKVARQTGDKKSQIDTPAERITTNSLLLLRRQKVSIAAIIITKGNTCSALFGSLATAN